MARTFCSPAPRLRRFGASLPSNIAENRRPAARIAPEARTFRFQSNGVLSHGSAEKYLIPDDVPFVDHCNGHTLVDGGNYHDHGIPVCMTASTGPQGEHSRLVGGLVGSFPDCGNEGGGGPAPAN